MSDFQVGEFVAEVPHYNWKMYVVGFSLDEIPGVRFGKIINKRSLHGNKHYPVYTVQFGTGLEQNDGVNLVRVEVEP